MGKGKNWGFLQKFEIYRNVELLHQSHTRDDSSYRAVTLTFLLSVTVRRARVSVLEWPVCERIRLQTFCSFIC